MIQRKATLVSHDLDVLWTSGTVTGLSDAQLVGRFAGVRDATAESAFRELMRRHGPMVMGVCRQILRHTHDADDAFQATFLVLVRKARSIRVGESLAPWLYSVAYRTAQRARVIASRYRAASVEPLEKPMESSADDLGHFDLRPLLHEELNRLPGKYREPIVLCHLEGKTHEEAARLLHWPVGTVSGRLSRGRELLRSRLKRRGVEVSPAMVAAHWLAGTPTFVAIALIESTVGASIRLAAPAVSTAALALTQGVLAAMLLNRIKMTVLVVLLVGGMTAGVGVLGIQALRATTRPDQIAQQGPAGDVRTSKAPVQRPADKPFTKNMDPLPRGTGPGMGLSLPPARLKNSPIIDPRRFGTIVHNASMVLVESADRTAWEAMSLEKERPQSGSMDKALPGWTSIKLPPGTTAQPILADNFAVLRIKGKKIDQVAAYTPGSGRWVTHRLLKSVEDEINPAIGPGLALYQAGNDFYAFTPPWLGFSVLHLEGDEEATAWFGPSDIEVMQGNRLYVFSPKAWTWTKGVDVYLPPSAAGPKREVPAAAQKPVQ